jgi:hypothetical protein
MRASAIRSLKLSLLSFLLGSAMALGATALDEIRPRAGDAPASGCAAQCGGAAGSDIPPCGACEAGDSSDAFFTKFSLPCAFQSMKQEVWVRYYLVMMCENGWYRACAEFMYGGCHSPMTAPPCEEEGTCLP